MQLNPAEFNAFLRHIGQRVQWRRSFACPCSDPSSGAARIDCPQCSGKGRLWNAPVDCVVGVAGSKVQREWAQFGQWESGDGVFTVGSDSPMYAAGQYDRVLMLDASDAFSENLQRDGTEKLYQSVERIERVFWLDDSGAIVEGGIPAIGADGVPTWASGEPPMGVQYNISGTRFTEYFVFNALPSDRNMHQGAQLPKKVVLRRFDLFGR